MKLRSYSAICDTMKQTIIEQGIVTRITLTDFDYCNSTTLQKNLVRIQGVHMHPLAPACGRPCLHFIAFMVLHTDSHHNYNVNHHITVYT